MRENTDQNKFEYGNLLRIVGDYTLVRETEPMFDRKEKGHSFVSVAYIKNKAQLYDVANVTGLVCNISEIARVEKTEEAILFEKSNTYSVWWTSR